MHSFHRALGAALLLLAGLLLTLGLAAFPTGAAPASDPATGTITVPVGGTATLPVRGFCLDFGKPFPVAGSTAPTALADTQILAALNYAVNKGYPDSDPAQVQQAIWFLVTGTWHRPDHALADEIVAAAKDAANAPAAPGGTSLLDALKNHQVTATVKFDLPGGTTPENGYYGSGTLTITNTTSQDLQISLPLGSVFPPATAGDQQLLGYTLVQQLPTPTPAPTGTPVPTATPTLPVPTIPKTGGGETPVSGLLLLGTGLLALGAGLALLRRGVARA